jgi:hypothetical protein
MAKISVIFALDCGKSRPTFYDAETLLLSCTSDLARTSREKHPSVWSASYFRIELLILLEQPDVQQLMQKHENMIRRLEEAETRKCNRMHFRRMQSGGQISIR